MPRTDSKWRPRFSVRFLLLITAVVAVYLAMWQPTRTRGVRVIEQRTGGWNGRAPAPLVILVDEPGGNSGLAERRAYVWLFGPVVRLPYTASARQPSPYYLTDDVQYFAPGPTFRLTPVRSDALVSEIQSEDQ